MNRTDGHPHTWQVPTASTSCGGGHRPCAGDLSPEAREFFLLDWWFASSSVAAVRAARTSSLPTHTPWVLRPASRPERCTQRSQACPSGVAPSLPFPVSEWRSFRHPAWSQDRFADVASEQAYANYTVMTLERLTRVGWGSPVLMGHGFWGLVSGARNQPIHQSNPSSR